MPDGFNSIFSITTEALVEQAISNLRELKTELESFKGWENIKIKVSVDAKKSTGEARAAGKKIVEETEKEVKAHPISFTVSGNSFEAMKVQVRKILEQHERLKDLTGRPIVTSVNVRSEHADEVIEKLLKIESLSRLVAANEVRLRGSVTDTSGAKAAAASREAQRAANEQLRAQEKLEAALRRTQTEYQRTQLRHEAWQRRTISGMATMESNLTRFANRLQFLFAAAAAGFTVDLFGKTIAEFSQVEGAIRGAEVTATRFGQSGSKMLRELRDEATGFTFQMGQAADTINKLLIGGVAPKPGDTTKLKQMAIGAATLFGTEPGKNIQDIGTGILRLSPRILDNLGLIVRAKDAYAEYGAMIGKDAKELTGAEKVLAFWNKTMNNSGTDALVAASRLKTPFLVLEQAKTTLDDLKLAFGEVMGAGLMPFLGGLDKVNEKTLTGIARVSTWALTTAGLSYVLGATAQGASAVVGKVQMVIALTQQLRGVEATMRALQTGQNMGMFQGQIGQTIYNSSMASAQKEQLALMQQGALAKSQVAGIASAVALTAVIAALTAAYQEYTLALAEAERRSLDLVQLQVQYEGFLSSIDIGFRTAVQRAAQFTDQIKKVSGGSAENATYLQKARSSLDSFTDSLTSSIDKLHLSQAESDKAKAAIQTLTDQGWAKAIVKLGELEKANGGQALSLQQVKTVLIQEMVPSLQTAIGVLGDMDKKSGEVAANMTTTWGKFSNVFLRIMTLLVDWAAEGIKQLAMWGTAVLGFAGTVNQQFQQQGIGSFLVPGQSAGDIWKQWAPKEGAYMSRTPDFGGFLSGKPADKNMVADFSGFGVGLTEKLLRQQADSLEKLTQNRDLLTKAFGSGLEGKVPDATTGDDKKEKAKSPDQIALAAQIAAAEKQVNADWAGLPGGGGKICVLKTRNGLLMWGGSEADAFIQAFDSGSTSKTLSNLQGLGAKRTGLTDLQVGDLLFMDRKNGPNGGADGHTAPFMGWNPDGSMRMGGNKTGSIITLKLKDGKFIDPLTGKGFTFQDSSVPYSDQAGIYGVQNPYSPVRRAGGGGIQDLPKTKFMDFWADFQKNQDKLLAEIETQKGMNQIPGFEDFSKLAGQYKELAQNKNMAQITVAMNGWAAEASATADYQARIAGATEDLAKSIEATRQDKYQDIDKKLGEEIKQQEKIKDLEKQYGIKLSDTTDSQVYQKYLLDLINSDLEEGQRQALGEKYKGLGDALIELQNKAKLQAAQLSIDRLYSQLGYKYNLAAAFEPDANRRAVIQYNETYDTLRAKLDEAAGKLDRGLIKPNSAEADKLLNELEQLHVQYAQQYTGISSSKFLYGKDSKAKLEAGLNEINTGVEGMIKRLAPDGPKNIGDILAQLGDGVESAGQYFIKMLKVAGLSLDSVARSMSNLVASVGGGGAVVDPGKGRLAGVLGLGGTATVGPLPPAIPFVPIGQSKGAQSFCPGGT